MSERSKGRILIVCTALLWGLAGLCVKSVSWQTPAIISVRSIISLLMLFAAKKSFKLKFSPINILAAVSMSATGILYIEAIKLTTAGTAIVLQYIAPILVFLYSVIFKKKKARAVEIVLTLLVFGGCVLSFSDSIDMSHMIGNLLALLSGFTFAAQIIIMNTESCDNEDCTIIGNMISFLFCLPFAVFGSPLEFTAKNIIWVLVLGIFQYGLANLLFAKGIKKVDSVEGSLLLTLEPIFNPIPVAIFCNEIMGAKAIIGSAVVILAVTLYNILPRKEK